LSDSTFIPHQWTLMAAPPWVWYKSAAQQSPAIKAKKTNNRVQQLCYLLVKKLTLFGLLKTEKSKT